MHPAIIFRLRNDALEGLPNSNLPTMHENAEPMLSLHTPDLGPNQVILLPDIDRSQLLFAYVMSSLPMSIISL